MRFFRWYCHPKLVNHIEGDLLEDYQVRVNTSGKFRANMKFMIEVILLFRPGIISPRQRSQSTPFAMYKSYFIIGWRNLLRNSGYSFINIGGLAIGMAVAMLNGLWIWDELSFNKYHKNYDRIAQVAESAVMDGNPGQGVYMVYPLGTELKENYNDDFKAIARASSVRDPIVAAGDKKVSTYGMYVDPIFPEMMTFDMVQGSRAGLKTNQSVMLSASLAKSLFGDEDAINKTVRISNDIDATVSGVYKDMPVNSEFSGMMIFGSWDLYLAKEKWIEQTALNNLRNHFIRIYVEIKEGNTFDKVTKAIAPALKFDPQDAEQAKKFQKAISLYPMSRWHLYSYKFGQPDSEPRRMVQMVGAIGLFILLLACINFMNLSTARSEKRAKEVGIRKTIGSMRGQLINQFFSESFIVVVFGFIVALGIASLALPQFNDLAGKQIAVPWINVYFWTSCLVFIVFTSVIAGSYPAFYLSSFNPVTTLKGKIRAGRLATLPRKILVVTQFSISVILIICTAVVYQQIQFAKNRPVGYNREGLVMIAKRSGDFYGKYDVLRTELKNTGAVEEISESLGAVTQVVSGSNGWDWEGRDPNVDESFVTHAVTATHGRTVGWQFVDGHDFDIDNPADSFNIIINEASAKFMGLKNPVGQQISWKWWEDGRVQNYKIIGVIRNFVMDSPYAPPIPAVFYMKGFNGGPNWINIRLNANVSVSEAMPKIENVFKKIIPSAPFEYSFVDQEYALKFAAEERVGKLASIFAILAIFISCLGLFGLASFVAEQRTKEIGIRKVLGATLMNVWRMLSKDFIVLVLIACVVSVPVARYLMMEWLQKYNYRINLTVWVFAGTCIAAIVITLATVSFQAIKAGVANPVKSLRSE